MSTPNINYATDKSTKVQKGIQAILVERRLWPPGRVRLVYNTLKCKTCQALSTCGICVHAQKFNSCKEVKYCSGKWTKQRIYDKCLLQKARCECMTKKYCAQYKKIRVQKSCSKCEKMPLKCNSESKTFIS